MKSLITVVSLFVLLQGCASSALYKPLEAVNSSQLKGIKLLVVTNPTPPFKIFEPKINGAALTSTILIGGIIGAAIAIAVIDNEAKTKGSSFGVQLDDPKNSIVNTLATSLENSYQVNYSDKEPLRYQVYSI